MGAAFVTARAHDLNLVGDSFTVGAAVFFLFGSGTAAGWICAFFRSVGHEPSSTPNTPGIPDSMPVSAKEMQHASAALSDPSIPAR
jgi:hypothetical protein